MKDFKDYQFANITEQENNELKNLEDQIKSESGKDVVLIAYQEKKDE